MNKKSFVIIAFALAACGGGSEEPNAAVAQMADAQSAPLATVPTTVAIGTVDDLPDDAISIDPETGEMVIEVGTVADLGGHADAIPADDGSDTTIAQLWIGLGADHALADCYDDLFEKNGWTASSEAELSELQANFSPAEAKEFATC